jgi:hypothetical protein
MKRVASDPPRWREHDPGPLGAAFRSAEPLALPGPDRLARIHDQLMERPARRSTRIRYSLGIAAALVLAANVTVLARTSLYRPAPLPASITVPAGSTVRLARKHRWRLTLTGPAAADLGGADSEPLILSAGQATVSADEQPVVLALAGVTATVAPAGLAEVELPAGGLPRITARAGQVTVRSAAGPPRILAGGATWGEPPPQALAPPLAGTSPPAKEKATAPPIDGGNTAPRPRRPRQDMVAARPAAARAPMAMADERPRRVASNKDAPAPVPAETSLPSSPPLPVMPPAIAALPPAAVTTAPVGAEAPSRALRQAIEELRQRRDPQAALALLERDRPALAAAGLGPEVDLVRIEALLALGRTDDVLRILEPLSLATSYPPRRDLRVLRGELRASAGHCLEAMADFVAARQAAARDELDERALYGLGSCLARAGDRARARAVLADYLRLYPRGKFATDARRALAP